MLLPASVGLASAVALVVGMCAQIPSLLVLVCRSFAPRRG